MVLPLLCFYRQSRRKSRRGCIGAPSCGGRPPPTPASATRWRRRWRLDLLGAPRFRPRLDGRAAFSSGVSDSHDKLTSCKSTAHSSVVSPIRHICLRSALGLVMTPAAFHSLFFVWSVETSRVVALLIHVSECYSQTHDAPPSPDPCLSGGDPRGEEDTAGVGSSRSDRGGGGKLSRPGSRGGQHGAELQGDVSFRPRLRFIRLSDARRRAKRQHSMSNKRAHCRGTDVGYGRGCCILCVQTQPPPPPGVVGCKQTCARI